MGEKTNYKRLNEFNTIRGRNPTQAEFKFDHQQMDTLLSVIIVSLFKKEYLQIHSKRKGFLRNLKRFFTWAHHKNLFWFRGN